MQFVLTEEAKRVLYVCSKGARVLAQARVVCSQRLPDGAFWCWITAPENGRQFRFVGRTVIRA